MMPRRAHSRPPRHERASPGGGYEALPGVRCHWRALDEIAAGGGRALARIAGVVDAARRVAWAQVEARHGALPAWAGADEVLDGVTCLRLDATMVACRSEKQGAGSTSKASPCSPWAAGVRTSWKLAQTTNSPLSSCLSSEPDKPVAQPRPHVPGRCAARLPASTPIQFPSVADSTKRPSGRHQGLDYQMHYHRKQYGHRPEQSPIFLTTAPVA